MTNKNKFFTTPIAAAIGMCAIVTGPAMAQQNTILSVGHIVMNNRSNGSIIVPSDSNGEVRLTGLAAGTYSVKLFDSTTETSMTIGKDGALAFVVREEKIRPKRKLRYPGPLVRRWYQQIPFDSGPQKMPADAVIIDMKAQFRNSPPMPCAFPPPGIKSTCRGFHPLNYIDVNASNAAEMQMHAATLSAEAAAGIVSEREKNGRYKDATDFARRVCTVTAIDFDDASLRMGDTTIAMKRGTDPKVRGWKCEPRDNMVRLFNSSLGYVGHVTLLR